jgi:uncharacterized oligopeptide transporter (OPT) family protein
MFLVWLQRTVFMAATSIAIFSIYCLLMIWNPLLRWIQRLRTPDQ